MNPSASRGGRKSRRPFYIPYCFSAPFVSDPHELDPSPKTSPARRSSPAFFFSRLRRRIRTVPVDETAGDGRMEAASPEIGAEGKRRKGLFQNLRKKRRKTTAKPLTICHMSTEYNFRCQPRAPLHHVQEPVQTGIRTSHPGSPKATQTGNSTRSTTRATGRVDMVSGLLILAATLAALLFFGRGLAVFWSSVWLCFLPLVLPSRPPLKKMSGVEVVDVESAEYKKKVVLMGLLERNR